MQKVGSLIKQVRQFSRNRIPGQVVIQITNRCNALCPQCGMRSSAAISRTSLSDSVVRRILDACSLRGVQAVSFTGGEPLLLRKQLLDWANYAGKVGIPFIRTGTNGFLFRGANRPGYRDRIKHLAEELAMTPLRNFWISIDSSEPETHERMRGLPGVVSGIEEALPLFHAAGLYPSANLGINRLVGGARTNNLNSEDYAERTDYLEAFYSIYRQAFHNFYRLVLSLGFTTVNTCYPMSIGEQEQQDGLNAVYGASVTEDVVRFADDEKAMLYKALMDTIPDYRSRLRIFSPLSSIYMLYRTYTDRKQSASAFGCRGGVDFFFIDAEKGDTYPCGYRGDENMGKLWDLDTSSLSPGDDCHRCDWECFRDPSELCGPLLDIVHAPFRLLGKMKADPVYRRLWLEDIRYYRLCDLFDGRRPSRPEHLQRYSPQFSSKTITSLTPA
jgi:MoaA/NifB/PqqE/SkfB family radical SAM enzyme